MCMQYILVKPMHHLAADLFGSYTLYFDDFLCLRVVGIQPPVLLASVSEQNNEVFGFFPVQNLQIQCIPTLYKDIHQTMLQW